MVCGARRWRLQRDEQRAGGAVRLNVLVCGAAAQVAVSMGRPWSISQVQGRC
jgi:hypothetical protein